ncbi:TetR family transcriptional regulator [Acidocella sp. KAb 2-4]|uniref:TetR family transcriptional regulator n=1 Tax=Acidocella sp. KAb 2-4 TaxID=2885158 RepID=UPI001D095BB6|nr:TetR family transcriptional regulator [Acidocella sp. KAb 2-4]MCB5944594.1 TetR family transcriptional regulator [Acidocella sp. KAb 2-4]
MTDTDFDTALVTAAFALGAEKGWRHVSPAAAARHAGLDLAQVRAAYPCTGAILKKFGQMADAVALTNALTEGSVRDRLFDILLRRFDFLQAHRAGVVALLRTLPFCPPLALAMAELNIASMGWLLEGAGVDATGLRGALAKRGLLVVWAYGIRAWADDESEDLTATMAAVDKALARAEAMVSRFGRQPVADPDAPLPPGASPLE